jgi:anti-sigma B factor antagonist
MEIVERELSGIKVLDLKGKFRAGQGEVELRQRIVVMIAAGHRQVIVNLSGVPYMDSSGLGELVRCSMAARKSGGQIKLSSPSRRLVDLLRVTRLDSLIETHHTDAHAAASFTK